MEHTTKKEENIGAGEIKNIDSLQLIIPLEYSVEAVKEHGSSHKGKLCVKGCRKRLEEQLCEYIVAANPRYTMEDAQELLLDQYVDIVIADDLGLETIPVDLLKHPELEKFIEHE
jgi:hypothetical protein